MSLHEALSYKDWARAQMIVDERLAGARAANSALPGARGGAQPPQVA
jgi:hypothetical protein